ncbi:MAG TPA: 50S ribosomal protein L4 [Gemmatimonadaceae bacterium]|nr:50S ribosomal protein L4 [Gemmatimonadaceae bacterium]
MAESTTMDAAAYTVNGTARERVPLPAELFDGTVNMPVMHQAVKAYLANQRQGNAATKTRGLVTGGNQKPWKQKGTGRARQGSIRAPNWRGGGTVFGPIPRSYAQYVPRRVRFLARKSAFNARAREGAVLVVDRFEFDKPRTARLAALVDRLGLTGQKVLVLTDGVKPHVFLSGRNLPTVHVMPFSDASTYHILWSDAVVVESAALGNGLEPIETPRDIGAREERGSAPKRPSSKTRARKKSAAEEEGDEAASAKAGGAKSSRKAAGKRSAGPARKRAAGGGAKKTAARKSAATKSARKSTSKSTPKRAARKATGKSGGKPKKKGS